MQVSGGLFFYGTGLPAVTGVLRALTVLEYADASCAPSAAGASGVLLVWGTGASGQQCLQTAWLSGCRNGRALKNWQYQI